MIKINGVEEIIGDPGDNLNLTDIILDVDIAEEDYIKYGLETEVYPKDAWAIWVSQNDYDRLKKNVGIALCNEGLESVIELTEKEKEYVLQYIKDNNLDKEANFIL